MDRHLQSAHGTFSAERDGIDALIKALANGLGAPFGQAVELLRTMQGRAVLAGVGKSGHIARKVAATMASTGTPASFVHPTEASHGDLGMVSRDDVILMFSNSGETAELRDMLLYAGRFAVPVIAITAHAKSTLALAARVVLCLPGAPEACPIGLAPTTSTTMQLVTGDALAVALLQARGFTADDFQRFHPGGRLGAALTCVRDIMHTGERMPLVASATLMGEALVEMTAKSFGCLGIVDDQGALTGVITDGDLRRHMSPDLPGQPVTAIMSKEPRTVGPGLMASGALEIINSSRITSLFVVENGKPAGIVHVHDLLRAGVR